MGEIVGGLYDHECTRESIFPVLRFDFEPGREVAVANLRGGHYLGTGFFLADQKTDGLAMFLTARHVVEVPLAAHQRIGIGQLSCNGAWWWEHFEFHRTADLALAVIQRKGLPQSICPLRGVDPSHRLGLGAQVAAFGFPLTAREERPEGGTIININEVAFRGYVASVFDRDGLPDTQRAFSINYALNFECPHGLSGAPLLVVESGAPAVCGLVYGNKSTHYLTDEITEIEDQGGTRQERAYRVYHFGLASSLAELGEPKDSFAIPTGLYPYMQ